MSGAAMARRRSGKHRADVPRIGLALAGGGPLGGIYEVGALLALTDPRPLLTRPRGVRQSARDLAHTLDRLETWLAAASAT